MKVAYISVGGAGIRGSGSEGTGGIGVSTTCGLGPAIFLLTHAFPCPFLGWMGETII